MQSSIDTANRMTEQLASHGTATADQLADNIAAVIETAKGHAMNDEAQYWAFIEAGEKTAVLAAKLGDPWPAHLHRLHVELAHWQRIYAVEAAFSSHQHNILVIHRACHAMAYCTDTL
ncbi:MAG: hypothetical protein Q9M22_07675 [Mariprofundaceae bacterium]|nr:hypothetical protein [Mariprofundaceae bacterium]